MDTPQSFDNLCKALKNLYTELIANRKHELQGWHDAYRNLYDEVAAMRERIKSGVGLSRNDKAFLERLIYQKNNGIAAIGQSVLKKAKFEALIENDAFIAALQEFILTPNNNNFLKFAKAWADEGKGSNPVRVNRVAAACTLEVSTTVDFAKFAKILSWLSCQEIIPENLAADKNWFTSNCALMNSIHAAFAAELNGGQTDKFYLSMLVWLIHKNQANPFSLNKQVIKYGAPGTGKTYQALQQTALLFDIWQEEFDPNGRFCYANQQELVQFHPAFSYEDFIEGLRPVLDDNGTAQLTLQNGVFKEFCRNAGKWELDVYRLGFEQDFAAITIDELRPYQDKLGEHWQHIFALADTAKPVAAAVPPFFFIIDEVNRAELSRVFGELMYCLEYRGIKGSIKTQYANLNNARTGMLKRAAGYQFFIPANIYLIGTMNTIDRSVESFDFALRRRFHWEEVAPNIKLLKYHLREFCQAWVPLADNLAKLNAEIANNPLLGHDYQIGHAYLMNLKYAKSLALAEVRARVWADCIRPLLHEYLRGTGKEAELGAHFSKAFGL